METKERGIIYSERTSKKQPFDKRLIEHVVGLLREGVPRREIVAKYGVTGGTLREWVRRHAPDLGKRRSFTNAEKRSVVRAIESGMSVKQAQIAFGISYPSVIRKWVKDFAGENAELRPEKPIAMAKKTAPASESAELRALRKALEEANLKIRALDTMIDIAEEQLKVDIRKKSGAKQSSK